MKQTVYLQFLPEYDAYGISDEKIAELRAQNIIPLIELQPADYQQLAGSLPAPQKPTVAFLLGREKLLYHRYALCQSYCTIWRKHPLSDL